MNLVGKILVTLIFVMTSVYLGFAVSVYSTHKTWREKATTLSSKIAPASVNEIYDTARKAGADGGKLLGAGGGGFMLIFVEPERRAAVLRALDKLLPVPFQFERGGTQLVLYEAETMGGGQAG